MSKELYIDFDEYIRQGEPSSPDKLPDNQPDKLPRKLADKFETKNENIIRIVHVIGEHEFSVKEMLKEMGLRDRENFMDNFLTPAIDEGFVRMLHPESPRHPRQKYLLTVKGIGLLASENACHAIIPRSHISQE